MKLSIRKLQPRDIGLVARLLDDFMSESDENSYPSMDDTEIEKQLMFVLATIEDPNRLYLIAFDGKKPIGWFYGEILRRAWGKPEIFGLAREMYVVPEKRGLGVANRLIKTAVQYAYALGCGAFEQSGSPRTQPRWEKLGFRGYVTYGYMPGDVVKKYMKGELSDDEAPAPEASEIPEETTLAPLESPQAL